MGWRKLWICGRCGDQKEGDRVQEAVERGDDGADHPPASAYARTRNERLAGITDRIAEKVLSVDFGAPVVRKTEVVTIPDARKCLPEQALRATGTDWRRGDSNPRPEMLQDKHPTCLVAALWISPCEAPRDRLITRLFRCISPPSARTTDESQPTN